MFGRTFELGPTGDADDGWNLFGVTDTAEPRAVGGEQRTSPWFFLALVLPDALESQPVETVLMLRDEMANLAWAVEAFVSDDAGGILDRFGSSTMNQPAAGLAPAGIGRYRVDTVVPDHWFPLAPEPREDRESVVLRLVPLARRVGGEVTTLFPLGRSSAGPAPSRGQGSGCTRRRCRAQGRRWYARTSTPAGTTGRCTPGPAAARPPAAARVPAACASTPSNPGSGSPFIAGVVFGGWRTAGCTGHPDW